MRLSLVRLLLRIESRINSLLNRFDRCRFCEMRAAFWCENCGNRHCWDHESFKYADCDCCDDCAKHLDDSEEEIEEEEVKQ